MNLAHDVNSGGFFNQQLRESKHHQLLETFCFSPPKFAGDRFTKVSGGISSISFDRRNWSL